MKDKVIRHLSKDKHLQPLLLRFPFPELEGKPTKVYEHLLKSIVSQQLSGKAADTIHGRFLNLFPRKKPIAERVLELDFDTLRGVGLSRQKATYIQNVAHFFIDHKLKRFKWNQHSDEEILQLLTEIKGVGTWTVQMILMFSLNRTDILPIDDLGIRNAMIRLYGLTSEKKQLKKELLDIAEPWRPYRTYVCRYLWWYIDEK